MTLQRSLRVLIVDDEDSFRMSLEIALKMSDKHIVESCESGEIAVDLLQNNEYDVILLDYKLPEMSGLDVLRWMREKNIDTPVIMLTGMGSEELAVDVMKLGAYDYISKTHLEIDRLGLTIESVYDRYLYRKEVENRKLEERREKERQKALASLQTFQHSINSLGQFLNNGVTSLEAKMQTRESELLKFVNSQGEEEVRKTFTDLKQELEIISSGVKSILDLSALVAHKLDSLQNNEHEESKDTAP